MIEIGQKYGCLTVLDDGSEYKSSEVYNDALIELQAQINKIKYYEQLKDIDEKRKIIERQYPTQEKDSDEEESTVCSGLAFFDWMKKEASKPPEYSEEQYQWFVEHERYYASIKIHDLKKCVSTHYKCQCKCGKVHYYTEQTLLSKPRYCYYPVLVWRKKDKNLECIKQCHKPHKQPWYVERDYPTEKIADESLPSEEYCEYYNRYKTKQLKKSEEAHNEMLSKLPRHYAKNYDIDFTGRNYESLHIIECIDDHAESKPEAYYTQMAYNGKRKHWTDITVYKQYRCRCKLCGKEQIISCDKFGIYPPTPYGYHAYFGYWSDAFCDCHKISSFQWIVCKILFENNVDYEVEYSFDDLYGIAGQNLLRFDFAVKDANNKVKCLIECQGEQHFMPVEEFGGELQYQKQIKNDQIKRDYAEKHGILLIEISYKNKKEDSVLNILKANNII